MEKEEPKLPEELEGIAKGQKEFDEKYKKYKSFMDITPEEQAKFLALDTVREVKDDENVLELLLENEGIWVLADKKEIYNKAWGEK